MEKFVEIGIDIGSVSVGAIFLEEGKVVAMHYLPHRGDIAGALAGVTANLGNRRVKIGVTGKNVLAHPEIIHIDPIIAITDGACHLYPEAEHILYIGGESYTLVHLKGRRLQNYSSNSSCASGTGAFLEQQASRLGLDIAEFSDCAARFDGVPPRVATRCAVFAKSDIIHLQQDGVPVSAIAAGLCDSLVEGLVQSVFKEPRLNGLVVLAGGVALNRRVERSLARHTEKLAVGEYACVLGAYGAAMYAQRANPVEASVLLEERLYREKNEETRPALKVRYSSYPDFASYVTELRNDTEITVYRMPQGSDVYLGIDIGSTSTKAILTSARDEIVGFYTATAGKPVEAVKKILRSIKELGARHHRDFNFIGVGTTGSGRKLLKNILNADVEINEITAHARAAVSLYPEVDTIIEIGGQDSKFTMLSNGAVTNAVMNYVCAAGTGSFIEEQAKRLAIPLPEFSARALKGKAPITSERCTVYMERDINRLIRQGWQADDIAAAVIYSVRDNYLNKVVAGAPIGDHVVFQGATARNQALVAAFEEYLGKPIKVFPYAHLTGALGVCLLLKEIGGSGSNFKGFDFIDLPVELETEFCNLCHNNCRLTVVKTPEYQEGYGMMCGRDYQQKHYVPIKSKNFDFLRHYQSNRIERGTVLIPCALPMYEYLPLWQTFFQRLGFEVKVAKTSHKTFDKGKQTARCEFCAPILTAYGLAWESAHKDADMIFFPVFYKEAQQKHCFFCYYTSHLPALVYSQLPQGIKDKLVSPLLNMNITQDKLLDELFVHLEKYRVSRAEIAYAYEKSQQEYLALMRRNIEEGKRVLSQVGKNDIVLVIMGRPYNVFDPVMNAGLVEKIVRLGYPVLYYEMLDLPEDEISDPILSNIHWNYGQKIYRAAHFIAKSDQLFPIFLTSFRCSPDAFIMTYFKYLMDRHRKPYLIVQLDEHCSDVGYLTRVEAAIDSFKNWRKVDIAEISQTWSWEIPDVSFDKTILIPHIDEIASRLVASSFKSYGYKAVVLEESPATVLKGFRYAQGSECLAIPAIIGGIVRAIETHHLAPEQTVLFMPKIYTPCNFPQFPVKISLALEKEKMPVKVVDAGSFTLMQRLLFKVDLVLWDGLIISHALRQVGCALRPYEAEPGETDRKIAMALDMIQQAIEQNKNKSQAWEKAVAGLTEVATNKCRRPRLLVIGDLYVKNNDAFNQNLVRRIEDLGGEAVISSNMEYFHYGIELGRYEREPNLTKMASHYLMNKILASWENFYYRPIMNLLPIKEPSWDEMFSALSGIGLDIGVHGETAITVSRAICLARSRQIDAIVHINPAFCCPGNVSASLLDKVREDLEVQVLNIFYDGTDQPNNSLVPFLHYLCRHLEEETVVPGQK